MVANILFTRSHFYFIHRTGWSAWSKRTGGLLGSGCSPYISLTDIWFLFHFFMLILALDIKTDPQHSQRKRKLKLCQEGGWYSDEDLLVFFSQCFLRTLGRSLTYPPEDLTFKEGSLSLRNDHCVVWVGWLWSHNDTVGQPENITALAISGVEALQTENQKTNVICTADNLKHQ